MGILTLNAPSAKYSIHIEEGILDRCGKLAADCILGRRAVLVSDSNVAPLYLNRIEKTLEDAGFTTDCVIFPAGENTKRLENVAHLYSEFSKHGITRADGVFALGGGVIGDLTGFAAGSYLRGVPYFQIPTTLLAQVDSSIGGKTAVNLPEGKNLAGMFYQPAAVFADPAALDTLPEGEMRNGMAEVIKYALIADEKLLSELEGESRLTLKNIETCIDIKRKIVEEDERDAGGREILNFGHTFGHAVEAAGGYERFSHGQAVSIGMALAVKCGVMLGATPEKIEDRVLSVLKRYGLPHICPYSKEGLLPYMLRDKKRRGGSINLILLKDIGRAERVPAQTDRLESLLSQALEEN